MRRRVTAIGLAAASLVSGGVLVLGTGSGEAAPVAHPTCTVLRVTALSDHGRSTAYRVDLGSGAMTRLRPLERRVDALGYHRGQRLAYGFSGSHVVSLTADGALTVLGRVRGRVHGPSAGTVVGDALVVREGRYLHSVSIDPGSPRFLSVVRTVRLWPALLAQTVDDFDARGGLLYGVATHGSHHGRLIGINPSTGEVSQVNRVKLPGGRSYGSAAFGPDGALFAASNRTSAHDWHDGTPARSRLIRVELSASAKPVEIAAWPVAVHSDMTGCLAAAPAPPTTTPPPQPPPTTTTTVRPAPTTTVPPTTTTTAAPAPAPVPVVIPPPPPVGPPVIPPPPPARPPAAQPPPPPAPTLIARSSRRPQEAAVPELTPTEKKRRWGITTLVLLLGAGAAAGAGHRHRR